MYVYWSVGAAFYFCFMVNMCHIGYWREAFDI